MINKHQVAKILKQVVYPKGETYMFANNKLRFKVGSRPIRRKYVDSKNDIDRNDVLQINYLEDNFKPHHVLWDIGSHHGHYSLFAASVVNGDNQVYSFEPDDDARKVQQANIRLNKFQDKISLLDVAVSNTDGVLHFNSQAGNANSHLVKGGKREDEHKVVSVKSRTLNSLLHSLTKPTFVKIDTEGAEVDILSEAGELLSDASVKFICELHPFAWDYFHVNFGQLLATLGKYGRVIKLLDPAKKMSELPYYGTVLF